jgi:hypothetical protein
VRHGRSAHSIAGAPCFAMMMSMLMRGDFVPQRNLVLAALSTGDSQEAGRRSRGSIRRASSRAIRSLGFLLLAFSSRIAGVRSSTSSADRIWSTGWSTSSVAVRSEKANRSEGSDEGQTGVRPGSDRGQTRRPVRALPAKRFVYICISGSDRSSRAALSPALNAAVPRTRSFERIRSTMASSFGAAVTN